MAGVITFKNISLKKNIVSIFIISITFLLNACSKGGGGTQPPIDPCAGLSAKFNADVQPIINTTCANSVSCHGAGSQNAGGALTDYSKISAKSAQIKFQVENGLMPKNSSLTADQKNKIICWINSGSPNN